MKRISVFLVDDSALVRQLTTEILSAQPDIVIAGSAPDPIAAMLRLQTVKPDVILLDIEMPRMDGLEFLKTLRQDKETSHIPVLMFSTQTEKGCEQTLLALERGAVDFVTKPKIDLRRGIEELSCELVAKVRAAAQSRVPPRFKGCLQLDQPVVPGHVTDAADLIAIGTSTGGTEALREIFHCLEPGLPPIVIVQHMPERFTKAFAKRLDAVGPVRVKEAEDADLLQPGHAYIAPGNHHLEVRKLGGYLRASITSDPPVNGHRPSADVLFHSCVKSCGSRTIAAILTGMGNDGAKGLLALRRAGAYTIAQDQNSCVVFGMPKEAIQVGGATCVVPLANIAVCLRSGPAVAV